MRELIQRKLLLISQGREGEPITQPGEHPPCFETTSDYEAWLDACEFAEKTGVPLPDRAIWSGEPNYCHECSNSHRNRMRNEGRCLFPYTIFVEEGKGEDMELIGVEAT